MTLYNKMLVEQMHLKIDGLGRHAAHLSTPTPTPNPNLNLSLNLNLNPNPNPNSLTPTLTPTPTPTPTLTLTVTLTRLVIFLRKELDQRGLSGGPTHRATPSALTQAGDAAPTLVGGGNLGAQVEALGSQPDAAGAWEAMLTAPAAQPAAAPGAAGGADAAAGAAGTAAAAAVAAAGAARNNQRVANIVWFFGIYAAFKYLVDHDLWA